MNRLFRGPSSPLRHALRIGSTISAFTLISVALTGSQTIHADDSEDSSASPDQDDDSLRSIFHRLVTESSSRYDRPSDDPPYVRSADNALRQNEGSGVIQGAAGIARFDMTNVPSGISRHSLSSVRLASGTSWTFFGLYDGRNGGLTSDFLSLFLINSVFDSLLAAYQKYTSQYDHHVPLDFISDEEPPTESLSVSLDKKLKESFLSVDRTIIHDAAEYILSSPSRDKAVSPLHLAQSSSSALVAFFDSHPRTLKVASTGDSRAVLGRAAKDGLNGRPVYEVHVLTVDQDTSNQPELSRLQSLHPDEDLMVGGRYLGRTNTLRAFGEAALKWNVGLQHRMRQDYFGDRPPSNVRTPPYVTAEPEVTTFEVKPGDFLVMASSGLWKSLTNEEVVGLVGVWLETQKDPFNPDVILHPDEHVVEQPPRVVRREELPVTLQREDHTIMYSRWRTEKKFISVDNNVATHLARNALGGADGDLMSALLKLHPPFSARWRLVLLLHLHQENIIFTRSRWKLDKIKKLWEKGILYI
ncbi:hypothetical protein ONZ45_g14209 [Pleurotus djamor]|nr:hypothetical protein ONZ45_g14209 [Pleurotus djamor]